VIQEGNLNCLDPGEYRETEAVEERELEAPNRL
jgi:hypothetical protein